MQLRNQLSTGYIGEVMPAPALTRILESCRTRGLVRTSALVAQAGFCKVLGERIGNSFLQMIWRNEGMRYDRKHNVCTAHFVSIKTLKVVGRFSQCGSAYNAARPTVLREVFGRMPIDYREFTFIDFGSGMGRVLLWASDLPFHEIVGVEFSPELHEIAQRNISDYHSKQQRCFSIRSECVSAEDFPLPEGNLVLFFNNPFGPPVMELVLKGLEQALSARPDREIWVVYLKPTCGFLTDDAPFLERVAQSTTSNYYWYSLYRSKSTDTRGEKRT